MGLALCKMGLYNSFVRAGVTNMHNFIRDWGGEAIVCLVVGVASICVFCLTDLSPADARGEIPKVILDTQGFEFRVDECQ